MTERYLRALATAIPGVDPSRALAARSSAAVRAQLEQAGSLARQARISSTPSFQLARSGQPPLRFSPGALDSATFRAALEKLLSGPAARS